jgi:(S)-2-hydroxyglutarate dehydrogenase
VTKKSFSSDILICGGGVVALALARTILARQPTKKIHILEKESDVAYHSSGRNSGVLHAGFYYSANSLKAKFTKDGNRALKIFCKEKNIKINECQKVVVAQSEAEIPGIIELEKRGRANGVEVKIIDEKELKEFEPNAKTFEKALLSPTTATVDPVEICIALKNELTEKGVIFFFGEGYKRKISDNSVESTLGREFEAGLIINAAGLYADKIAKDFGFSQDFTIIPFKGIYLKYKGADRPVTTNIYPVPNLKNPFLGVHFTITVNGQIKIGPTAIPAFWRENYQGFDGFRLNEMAEIITQEARLFVQNSFDFRRLALEEMKKYNRDHLVSLAAKMVHKIDTSGFTEWSKPGIRAQLLNLKTRELVQDFVVEGDEKSVHVLNAVSPAFTSSFPFAEWIYENYLNLSQ